MQNFHLKILKICQTELYVVCTVVISVVKYKYIKNIQIINNIPFINVQPNLVWFLYTTHTKLTFMCQNAKMP